MVNRFLQLRQLCIDRINFADVWVRRGVLTPVQRGEVLERCKRIMARANHVRTRRAIRENKLAVSR